MHLNAILKKKLLKSENTKKPQKGAYEKKIQDLYEVIISQLQSLGRLLGLRAPILVYLPLANHLRILLQYVAHQYFVEA